MDYKSIEDEVYQFNSTFFEEISISAENNLDFIEDNHLHSPKVNYTVLIPFLVKTLKNFKILDSLYCSKTLNKLFLDLHQLTTLYSYTKKESLNIHEVFNSKFLLYSPTLNSYAKLIIDLKNEPNKIAKEYRDLTKLKNNFLELKKIYYATFEEIFTDDKKYFLHSLQIAINTKAYYFNNLLWKEARASQSIVKHLQIRKLNSDLNSKDYLNFTASLMRPYTPEYKYLQRCLKVFK